MKIKKLLASLTALSCCSGILLLAACGGVPQGITEDHNAGMELMETQIPDSDDEYLSAPPSPAKSMDLTPQTGVNNGIAIDSENETVQVTLHYITDTGYVVPVSERISKKDGIARECIQNLVESKENDIKLKKQGLNAPIPEGTEIGLSISDGVATVNLSGMERLESAELENALYAAIVNTLTQFPTVQVVTIYIDGSGAETENGSKPPKKMESCALNVEEPAIETGAGSGVSPITLYFPNETASLYVPVTRYLSGKSHGLSAAIAQLAAGTEMKGLRGCFPENTLILGAAIENGILNINCSADFMKVSETPELYSLAMQSTLLTAMKYGTFDDIRFYVNGIQYEPPQS